MKRNKLEMSILIFVFMSIVLMSFVVAKTPGIKTIETDSIKSNEGPLAPEPLIRYEIDEDGKLVNPTQKNPVFINPYGQLEIRKKSFEISDISLVSKDEFQYEGENYVLFGVQEGDTVSDPISECSNCPAIPYKIITWLIPEGYSSDDINVDVELFYADRVEVEYRVAPEQKITSHELEELSISEGDVAPLVFVNEPSSSMYREDELYEGEIKIEDGMSFGNGLRTVKIYIPALKYEVKDSKNFIYSLDYASLEIEYPYKYIERGISRFETVILKHTYNSNEYPPVSKKLNEQQPTKGIMSVDYTPNDPILLTASDLTDPNIEVDYLIITAPDFYPASASSSYPVYEFAMHKKNYNDFNVAIVNFDDIVSTYPNTGQYYREGDIPATYKTSSTNSHRVRNFLQFAWENWNGTHMYDNKPGYLLLVGDVNRGNDTQDWFMPTAIIYNRLCEVSPTCDRYSDEQIRYYATDLCYDDIYGECILDNRTFIVGRFPVQTTAELNTIVDKTIHFENDPTNGGTDEDWLSTYVSKIRFTFNQAQGITQEIFNEKPQMAILSKEWEVKYIRPSFYGDPTGDVAENKQRDLAEQGGVLFTYDGHGSNYNGGGGIYNDFALHDIDNSNKNMIFLSEACQPGSFQLPSEAWAEKILIDSTYPQRGAVLTTAYSCLGIMDVYDEMPAHLLFKNHTMLTYDSSGNLQTKSTFGHTTQQYGTYYLYFYGVTSSTDLSRIYAVSTKMLFGDPALDTDIFTEDYVFDESEHSDEIIVNQIQFPDPNLVPGRTVEAQSFVHNAGTTTLTNLDFSLDYSQIGYLTHYAGLSYSTLATTTLSSIAPNETKTITFTFTMPSETSSYTYFRVKMDETLDEFGDESDNGYVLVINNNGNTDPKAEPPLFDFWMSSGDYTCSGSPPLNPNQYGVCEGSKQKCIGGTWTEDYTFVFANKRTNFYPELQTATTNQPNWLNEDCNDRSNSSSPWHDGEGSLSYTIPEEDTYWNIGSWWNGKNEVVPKFNTDEENCGRVGNVCAFDEFCYGVDCEAAEFQIPNPNYIPGWTPEFLDVEVEAYEGVFCPTATCVDMDEDDDGYTKYIPLMHSTHFGYELFDESLGSNVDDTQTYDYTDFMFGTTGESMALGKDIEFWADRQYDCNDGDINVNSGAEEVCDGIDNNCQGLCEGGSEDGTTCYWGDYYDYETWSSYVGSTLHKYVELSYGTVKRCEVGGGSCNYEDEGFATTTYYADSDGDGYGDPTNTTESCLTSPPEGYVTDNTDCDDTNVSINPGAEEVCNAVDDNCDGTIDDFTNVCGTGVCAGEKLCTIGTWSDCSTSGNDAGICASCGEEGIPIYNESNTVGCDDEVDCTEDNCLAIYTCSNTANDSFCDNELYCDGLESCHETLGCQAGIPIDCSPNNLADIATCNNIPDSNSFTWDYFAGFTSVCSETTESCTLGTVDLTHTCNVTTCGAECDSETDCNNNTCEEEYVDYCNDLKLVEYNSNFILDSFFVFDSCENTCLGDCSCTDCETDCSAPTTNEYCVQGICGAVCDSNDDCGDTDCSTLSGCVGNDWYEYSNIANNCTDGCVCEENMCTEYLITTNDARCVECTVDADCNHLNNDYCTEDSIMQDEGKCVAYECIVETTEVENCSVLNSEYCSGTEILSDEYTCSLASCVIDETITLENCDNGLFCDGEETCEAAVCVAGTPVDCSENNLAGIATCTNDPDTNPFTWDYFAGFTSTCNEETDSCETGTVDLTHTCNITECGAECEVNDDCLDTDCSSLSECVGPDWYEYSNVSNNCTDGCACEINTCGEYIITENDARCLGIVDLDDPLTFGDLVTELSGVYYINDNVILVPKSYYIEGNNIGYDKIAISINNSNVILDCDGSTITGEGKGFTTDRYYGISIKNKEDAIIRNCNIEDYTTGIHLDNATYSTIQTNTIDNTHQGIQVYGSNSNTIIENEISEAKTAVVVQGSMDSNSNNNNITNNIIVGRTGIVNGGKGIELLYGAENNYLIGNDIQTVWDGISIAWQRDNEIKNNNISNATQNCIISIGQNNIIEGNTVEYCGIFGILIQASTNATVIDNIVNNNMGTGIGVTSTKDSYFNNNTAEYNTKYGLSIFDTTGQVDNNIFDNSRFCSNGISYFDVQESYTYYTGTNTFTGLTCDTSDPVGICTMMCSGRARPAPELNETEDTLIITKDGIEKVKTPNGRDSVIKPTKSSTTTKDKTFNP